MASKSSKAFSAWRDRMGYTYKEASKALKLCMASVGYYSVGERKETEDSESKPVEVPHVVLLACSALEAQLPPIK
jgi:hypothetical protein